MKLVIRCRTGQATSPDVMTPIVKFGHAVPDLSRQRLWGVIFFYIKYSLYYNHVTYVIIQWCLLFM